MSSNKNPKGAQCAKRTDPPRTCDRAFWASGGMTPLNGYPTVAAIPVQARYAILHVLATAELLADALGLADLLANKELCDFFIRHHSEKGGGDVE